MIGGQLKKLAREEGMELSRGYASGRLRGYSALLRDGMGTKELYISTGMDPSQMQSLTDTLGGIGEKQLMKLYRVQGYAIEPNTIGVIFYDNPGTMKRLRAFLDMFFPLMDQLGISRSAHCAYCGGALTEAEPWREMDGVPIRIHSSCTESFAIEDQLRVEQVKTEDNGTVMQGFIGAFLGALLGALVWAGIFCLGYITGLGGLLIGFFAVKGYDLLQGKQGKVKIIVVALCTIAGVLLGTVGGYAGTVLLMLLRGEFEGFAAGDFGWVFPLIMAQEDVISELTRNLLLGLFFAFLGCFSLLRNLRKSDKTRARKITDIK